MDPVNSAASILALVQVGAVLAKTAVNLYQGIRDAPVELNSVVNHVLLLQGQLSQLAQLSGDELEQFVSGETLRALQTALNAAKDNIEEIHDTCQKLAANNSGQFKGRIRWVLLDRKTVEKAQKRLSATEQSLTCALQILAMYDTEYPQG